ncbi:MAG: hypothetical protein PHQ98_01100 [Candidatus ainarchaeum sp.]|nr:hypothetical protein [Candidatus ainarchaeum sp.]
MDNSKKVVVKKRPIVAKLDSTNNQEKQPKPNYVSVSRRIVDEFIRETFGYNANIRGIGNNQKLAPWLTSLLNKELVKYFLPGQTIADLKSDPNFAKILRKIKSNLIKAVQEARIKRFRKFSKLRSNLYNTKKHLADVEKNFLIESDVFVEQQKVQNAVNAYKNARLKRQKHL